MRWPLASPQHLIGCGRGAPIISPSQATTLATATVKGLITGREEQAGC